MPASLTIQVRLGFSMGWRIWTPNEVGFYAKTLAHSYFILVILKSKFLKEKIWIVNYNLFMGLRKYYIFIEFLKFGMKSKEERSFWRKIIYTSLLIRHISYTKKKIKFNYTQGARLKIIKRFIKVKLRRRGRRKWYKLNRKIYRNIYIKIKKIFKKKALFYIKSLKSFKNFNIISSSTYFFKYPNMFFFKNFLKLFIFFKLKNLKKIRLLSTLKKFNIKKIKIRVKKMKRFKFKIWKIKKKLKKRTFNDIVKKKFKNKKKKKKVIFIIKKKKKKSEIKEYLFKKTLIRLLGQKPKYFKNSKISKIKFSRLRIRSGFYLLFRVSKFKNIVKVGVCKKYNNFFYKNNSIKFKIGCKRSKIKNKKIYLNSIRLKKLNTKKLKNNKNNNFSKKIKKLSKMQKNLKRKVVLLESLADKKKEKQELLFKYTSNFLKIVKLKKFSNHNFIFFKSKRRMRLLHNDLFEKNKNIKLIVKDEVSDSNESFKQFAILDSFKWDIKRTSTTISIFGGPRKRLSRNLRRSFKGKRINNITNLIWFWEKISRLISYYTQTVRLLELKLIV